MGPCRAIGAVLSADGAWLRLGVAVASAKAQRSDPPTLTWALPLRLVPLPQQETDAVGMSQRLFFNFVAMSPHLFYPQMRAVDLLIRTCALEAALPGAQAALCAAEHAARLRQEAAPQGLAAASARDELELGSLRLAATRAGNALSALRTRHSGYLRRLWMAAAMKWDSPLGAGNHSAAYTLPWGPAAGDGCVAVAKVAYLESSDLAAEAELLQALHLGGVRCDNLPRLLYWSLGSLSGTQEAAPVAADAAIGAAPAPSANPAFLVLAPLGFPLAAALAQLPASAAGGAAAAARRILADAVAEGLLAALSHAHARGVAHSNMKMENVVLAPPPPGGAGSLAELLSSGAWRPRAVLIDWATARALGRPASVRRQRGCDPDVMESLHVSWDTIPELLPRHDLECVAYIAASVAGSGDFSAEVPWCRPAWWQPAAAGAGSADDGEEAPGGSEETKAETGLAWVGPIACQRAVWLRKHPEALGGGGHRFLQHVRAGRVLYSWHVSDAEHDALLEQQVSAGDRRPLGGYFSLDNNALAAARRARAFANASSEGDADYADYDDVFNRRS